MSGPERPPEPTVPTTTLKRKHFSADDQEDLEDLDRIFKRIKTAVPRAPYILSTPSLHPYRYHSQQEAHAWMLGHLWHHSEEHLQYRTYHFREPYQDCFTLQHGEDEEEPKPERPKSQASNTTQSVAKKKISLSDYKSKQANGVITPGSKKPSPPFPAAKVTSVQTNGVKQAERQSLQAQKQDESRTQKRPLPESRAPEKSEKHDFNDRHSSAPLPPQPSSQKPESIPSKMDRDESGPSGSTPHGLPPLLSPVHQPLSNPYGLPDILSPTLPSNVQAELDRLETQRKRAESNASTSSSDRKSQMLSVPEVHSEKLEDVKVKSRVRSVSINEKSPSSELPLPNRANESETSLVVKLKFSKAKAPTVRQILRLPPKRIVGLEKKERPEVSKQSPVKVQVKAVDGPVSKPKDVPKAATRRPDPSAPSSKSTSIGTKVAEKRPRVDDDASSTVPSKRPRAHSSLDLPITPTQQNVSSPAPSNKSSAQKSQGQYATPRKDLKTISMLRTNSSESYDATPGRSGTTPTGSKQDARSAPTSSPLAGKKQADISLLAQTSMKLNKMGRSLKHEAQKIVTEKGNRPSKEDEKRAAVTSLECILSYMAAYYAQDLSLNLRGRAGEVEGTWKTLLPLCISYIRSTKKFRHLDGLRSYLSAVIAAAICNHVASRANQKAHDSPQDMPHAELAKQHTSISENFALLADHYTTLHRHSQEARIALPMDELQFIYKKTWEGREANSKLSKDPEKVSGARLSGPYFLPIGPDTTPIQAVRFGLKFLGEYCEKEKIDHTFHVNLEKPE